VCACSRTIAEANLKQHELQKLGDLEQTLETLREESEIAHALLGLSSALGELRTIEATLEKTVRIVAEIFGADRCFAATWNPETGSFKVTARAGYDEEAAGELDRYAARGRLPLLEEALSTRLPIIVGDVSAHGRLTEADRMTRDVGAYIGVPLTRWGQDFGGLGVVFKEPRTFTAKDEALARGVARQVGIVLSNARRYNLLNELRESSLQLGLRLRLADVTAELGRAATKLLKADHAAVFFSDASRRVLVPARGQVQVGDPSPPGIERIDLSEPVWSSLITTGSAVIESEDGGRVEMVAAALPSADAALLGAIVVSFSSGGQVQPDEVEALKVLAVQAGSVLENAQRFERQRQVARALQRGLVSTEMPRMEGCELGAVYEAASSEADIGGDFFDAFELPGGRLAVAVGDVSGKGAEAAAQTAMAKYMLRAFAIQHEAPAVVLHHLNEALEQGLGEDRFTTMFYAVIDQAGRRCRIAVAGHPPPLIYRSESGTVESVGAEGLLLGVFRGQEFEEQSIPLSPGDVMLSFTDGLLDARSEDELFGRSRVEEALARHAATRPAAELARAVYEDARSFGVIGDDTVVFAVVRRGGRGS
jgi:GAF domain-containing protein